MTFPSLDTVLFAPEDADALRGAIATPTDVGITDGGVALGMGGTKPRAVQVHAVGNLPVTGLHVRGVAAGQRRRAPTVADIVDAFEHDDLVGI